MLLDELNLGWGARLPMVLQTEAAECGLACLAMVAGYHGQDSNLAELRRNARFIRLSEAAWRESLPHELEGD